MNERIELTRDEEDLMLFLDTVREGFRFEDIEKNSHCVNVLDILDNLIRKDLVCGFQPYYAGFQIPKGVFHYAITRKGVEAIEWM